MAAPPPNNPSDIDWLAQLRQSYSQIQFGPGVVGKTTRATLALIGAWVVLIFRLGSDPILNASLLISGFVITGVYCWWVRKTHSFAEKFPQVALMEGAQLVEYQKWEAAVNGKTLGRSAPVEGPGDSKRLGVEQP